MAPSSKSPASADPTAPAVAAVERAWTDAQLALVALEEQAAHAALTRADAALAELSTSLAALAPQDAADVCARITRRLGAVKLSTEQALARCASEIARAHAARSVLRALLPHAVRAPSCDRQA
ncbi:MAG: hypothetical protein U1E76_24685 [Planctomycetota bacterium]